MNARNRGRARLVAVLAGAGLLFSVSAGAAGAGSRSAAELPGNKAFSGYSHDIKAYVLNTGAVTSGPVVAAGVGCSDRATLFFQDAGADVSLAGVDLGAVTTTSQGLKSGSVQETRSSFTAAGVNIPIATASLTADAITVTSSTFYDTATGAFTTSSSMNVTNLDIKLTPVGPTIAHLNGTVTPNTGITIPSIAEVVLHQAQTVGSAAGGAVGQASNALAIELLGGVTSTHVGEVYSSLYGQADQIWMFGEGQGVGVRALDDAVKVGPLVTAQLPCYGNGGVTGEVLGVNGLPASIGTLGAVKSTATGDRSGLSSDAVTTSQVAGVNLLGGVITADAVSSRSQVSTTDGAQTVSKAGSGSVLTNLVVAGTPIAADAPPNTMITLPAGLGHVIINAQNTFAAGIEIIPLVVHVNAINADVVVARSYAILLGPETGNFAMKQAKSFLSKELSPEEKLSTDQKVFKDGTMQKLGLVPKP